MLNRNDEKKICMPTINNVAATTARRADKLLILDNLATSINLHGLFASLESHLGQQWIGRLVLGSAVVLGLALALAPHPPGVHAQDARSVSPPADPKKPSLNATVKDGDRRRKRPCR